MSHNSVAYVSPEEYLERERIAETKHEYINGEIVAMAGGSLAHSLIAANIITALNNRIRGKGCHVFTSDARVAVRWGELIAYPDVSALCGPPAYFDDHRDTITNPVFVAEVLSPSTKNYDRGTKLRLYRMMPSFVECLLVEQTPVEVEHWRRLEHGDWLLSTIRDNAGVLKLQSLGCELPIADIYHGVEELLPDTSPRQ